MQHINEARDLATALRRDCLATRVARLQRVVARRFEQALRPTGLSMPQIEILAALLLVDRAIRPAELADTLLVERSTVNRNLALMQDRGWIDTVTTSPTGRSMTVTVSANGVEALASAKEAWNEAQQGVAKLLGPDAPPMLDTWLGLMRQAEVR